MNKWIKEQDIKDYPMITKEEVRDSLAFCVSSVLDNLSYFGKSFPYAASAGGIYPKVENRGWTTGFYTGQVWLAFENAGKLGGKADRERLLAAGEDQVDSFLDRIERLYDVEHHDLGFLYSPSCVAAYKLTGSEKARKAAVLAADKLITRFQETGEFIQAWGEMGAADNYRFIIDCLLNLPLLYWASNETGDEKYRDIAQRHIHTAMANVIREDGSTWHTVFMDNRTGKFHHGATCQGYKDGSAWARGQAWGVYGTAMAYRYTGKKEYVDYFKKITSYFLEHLPKDLCPYWDLTFGDGDEDEPRDSSSAVIASCGMLEMSRCMNDRIGQGHNADELRYYEETAKRLLKSVNDKYRTQKHEDGGGLVRHGTYSKKSPYNTCTPEGVDEYLIWGDYYFMEALNRLNDPDWNIYW